MRIRILKAFYYLKRNRRYTPGEVVDLPEEEIRHWIRMGMAMQDKSMDGAKETKELTPEPTHSPSNPAKPFKKVKKRK